MKQQVKLFEMDGIKLSFDEDTLEYIVDKAVEYNLGARGLRSIMESIMMDAMFEIPSKKVKTFKVTLESKLTGGRLWNFELRNEEILKIVSQ